MNYSALIGKKIRKLRQEMGLSQKEFGEKLGITGSFVGYLENGRKRINPNLLRKVAKITKQPVSYFYGEKPVLDKTLSIFNVLLEEKHAKSTKTKNRQRK